MSRPRIAAVVFHEGAGRGGAARLAAAVCARLAADGWAVDAPIRTEYAGHAEFDLAPRLARDAGRIVVVGGDGTMREVCSGLGEHATDTEVAMVPTGNANVIARELGIPLSPRAAVEAAASATTRPIDLGVVRGIEGACTERSFLAMVEAGYGARVVHAVSAVRSGGLAFLYRLWGDAVYAVVGTVELFRGGDPRVRVEVDGRNGEAAASGVVVANAATYAKGWSMTPDARIDSGRLECAARIRSSPAAILRQVRASRARRAVGDGSVTYRGGVRVVLESDAPFRVQVDGDPAGTSRRVEVERKAGTVRIVVPRPA